MDFFFPYSHSHETNRSFQRSDSRSAKKESRRPFSKQSKAGYFIKSMSTAGCSIIPSVCRAASRTGSERASERAKQARQPDRQTRIDNAPNTNERGKQHIILSRNSLSTASINFSMEGSLLRGFRRRVPESPGSLGSARELALEWIGKVFGM